MKCSKDEKEAHDIADVTEITEFWTIVMRDEQTPLKDKLKVSELLAKAQGAFENSDEEDLKEDNAYDLMTLKEKLRFIDEYIERRERNNP